MDGEATWRTLSLRPRAERSGADVPRRRGRSGRRVEHVLRRRPPARTRERARVGVPGHLHLQRRAQAAARRLLHLRALRSRQRHLRHVLGVRSAAPARASAAGYKLSVARGHLDVAFASAPTAPARWTTRRDGRRRARCRSPTSSTLFGRDADGRRMRARARRSTRSSRRCRSAGREYGGVKTCMGQYGTHSYFQSDVRFRGTLEWGDVREEVEGDSGWIDRQWTPRHLGVHTDRRNTPLPPRVAPDPSRQRHRDERLAARRPPARQPPRFRSPARPRRRRTGASLATTEFDIERH